jgi:hypothetical protein
MQKILSAKTKALISTLEPCQRGRGDLLDSALPWQLFRLHSKLRQRPLVSLFARPRFDLQLNFECKCDVLEQSWFARDDGLGQSLGFQQLDSTTLAYHCMSETALFRKENLTKSIKQT